MGRKVQVRVHYQPDAAYLQRLMQAVEKDTRQSVEWRTDVTTLLQRIIIRFMDVDRARMVAKVAKAGGV